MGIKLTEMGKGDYYRILKNLLEDPEIEGFYKYFYKDSQGYLTIGIGTAFQIEENRKPKWRTETEIAKFFLPPKNSRKIL